MQATWAADAEQEKYCFGQECHRASQKWLTAMTCAVLIINDRPKNPFIHRKTLAEDRC